MQLSLASQDDFFSATAAGRVSSQEVLRILHTAIDAAAEQGLDKILIDLSEVTGELSVSDLYTVGRTMAEYCASKSIHPRLAVIGKPPTVTGFGAQVASNRGLISKTFSETEPALNWLRAFGSKAQRA